MLRPRTLHNVCLSFSLRLSCGVAQQTDRSSHFPAGTMQSTVNVRFGLPAWRDMHSASSQMRWRCCCSFPRFHKQNSCCVRSIRPELPLHPAGSITSTPMSPGMGLPPKMPSVRCAASIFSSSSKKPKEVFVCTECGRGRTTL
jgi:hypothetical protein